MKAERRIYTAKKKVNLPLKRKINLYFSKILLISKLTILLVIVYLIISKQLAGLTLDFRVKISEFLADYGFSLENVVIAGQKNIPNSEIVKSLNADVGTPIFTIDLNNSLNELSQNGWVKNVILQRKLPDTIIVNLEEREPIALWQHKKQLFVIDRDGEIIKNSSPEKFRNFIYVVGDDANVYATELIDSLSKHPGLAGKVIYAVRFGQRRWDLKLEENITVRMPQHDFAEAYDYLIRLYEEKRLFGAKLKNIDLRDSKKVYLEKEKSVEEIKSAPKNKTP